ncbi:MULTISPECIES: ROK family protein [Emticicia]|uniref:ROK family protein n=1 Tax=Emticicia TaxID=312278 RepID=UPI00209F600E|nr:MULTISPECIES: ROK family protein [Emticicia]UTA67108.1 ROK family protein [Emticicia sp. 21SJ11W-3]
MNIGVDLGGTKIKAGVEMNGAVIKQETILLQDKDSLSSTLQQLIDLIKPLMAYSVNSIGIGVPSVVDTEKGIVYDVTNIPSWKKVDLKDILQQEFNVPVFVNNDVNCFTLGESRFGLAQGFSSVVGVTTGTGLGSGIIINNQLYVGNNCGAGEIGLLPYLDQNLEYYTSNNFFEAIHGITALEANHAAMAGNKIAIDLWDQFGKHLGTAIKTIMYAYDPQAIVLGGSLSKAYPFFEKGMYHALGDFSFPESLKRLKIFVSQDENISLLGAAALIPNNYDNVLLKDR